ncbi:hypothetical protein MLD38_021297 [Melastoma candidum]|uniref:Uncharacterized protein n=1 Tax=Melastoma candidum TaxID=119954 RepID=A0ACB9QII9_9MYRT|nr:hypothetical protein MLD38_021297 [Melastoma candidum]
MIQGKYYSFSYPTESSSTRNLIPRTSGGQLKDGSCIHLGNSGGSGQAWGAHEMGEGRGILFMDPSRQKVEDRGACSIVFEKEHMFDKVVTPSDVGKLNRLVIPKQHAEKYFPLDSSNSEKGLLLNFEDRTGKPWRFRYSYWNSSQSYVMTKGWSRFVKEMKLDSGDIVSFQRGIGDLGKDRLFIDWRRRTHPPEPHPVARNHLRLFPGHLSFDHSVPWDLPAPQDYIWPSRTSERLSHPHRYGFSSPVGRIYDYGYSYGCGETPMRVAASSYGVYDQFHHRSSSSSPYMGRGEMDKRGRFGDGSGSRAELVPIYESVPLAQLKADTTTTKKFRLFGVNMECAAPDSTCDDKLKHPPPPDLMLYDGMPVTISTGSVNKGEDSLSLDLEI